MFVVVLLTIPGCSTLESAPASTLSAASAEEAARNAIDGYPTASESQNWEDFCKEFSTSIAFCERDAAQATHAHGAVSIGSVNFEIEDFTDTSLKVVFTGHYESGHPFRSETEALVVDGKVLLLNAAFWSPRLMTDSGTSISPTPPS